MKKILLSFLAILMSTVGAFADDVTFSVAGSDYDEASHSFSSEITIDLTGFEDFDAVEVPAETSDSGESVIQYRVLITYTTDATDPTLESDVYYDSSSKEKNPIKFQETGVVKALVTYQYRQYDYEADEEGVYNRVDTQSSWTDMSDPSDPTVYELAVINTNSITAPTLSVEAAEEGLYDANRNEFISHKLDYEYTGGVTVTVEDGFTVDEALSSYFDVEYVYTTNGNNPTTDYEANTYTDPFSVQVTSQVRAAVVVTVKDATKPVYAYDKYASVDLTRLDLVSAQSAVYDTPLLDGTLVYTKGLVLKVAEYDGETYSILSDGTSTFSVKGQLDENTYYFIGGPIQAASILGLAGFDLENAVTCVCNNAEQFDLPATLAVTEENLGKWLDEDANQFATALYNIAIPSTDLATADDPMTAKVGDYNLVLVLPDDLTFDPALYDGDALILGSAFGRSNGETAYIYVDNIIQMPEVEIAVNFGDGDVSVKVQDEVPANEDLEVTYEFNNIIWHKTDAEDAEVEITFSLRDEDGRQLYESTTTATLAGNAETLTGTFTIPADEIVPNKTYKVTIDQATTTRGEDILNIEAFDFIEKTFYTQNVDIKHKTISFFDTTFDVTVRFTDDVEVIDASKIYVLTDEGDKFYPNSVTADGNVLTFDIEGIMPVPAPGVALNFGEYDVVIPAEALNIEGFYNPQTIKFELTVGQYGDQERVLLLNDVHEYLDMAFEAPRGVNPFQYTPVTCAKFIEAIEEAIENAEKVKQGIQEEESLKKIHDKLFAAFCAFRPNLPKVNDELYIMLKDGDKAYYLNLSGEKPALSEEATSVQFHAVKTYDENEVPEPYAYKTYSWYIYDTPTRRYMGFDDPNEHNCLTLVTNQLYDFCVYATHYNNWYIVSSDLQDYLVGNVNDLTVHTDTWAEFEETHVDDEEFDPCWEWFITWGDPDDEDPQIIDYDGSNADTATVITSVEAAQLEGASFYSLSGAQLQSAKTGVNIVKFADGSVKKVFVK